MMEKGSRVQQKLKININFYLFIGTVLDFGDCIDIIFVLLLPQIKLL